MLRDALRISYAHSSQAVFARKKALVGGSTVDKPVFHQYCRQVVVAAVAQHGQIVRFTAIGIRRTGRIPFLVAAIPQAQGAKLVQNGIAQRVAFLMKVVIPTAVVLHPYLKPSCSWRFIDMDAHKQVSPSTDRSVNALRKINVFIAIAHHVYRYAIVFAEFITTIASNREIQILFDQAPVGRTAILPTMPGIQGDHHLLG